jgi:oligopeptide/dipeptide ABC transporter ATP-binding protein
MDDLLHIKNLGVYFYTDTGITRAVEDGSLRIRKGETVGLVGESGCGKTVTALSILRLLPIPPARIVSGKILFKGQDLLELSEDQLRDLRGKVISMIFQEPMAALNPVYTIGYQIAEAMKVHLKLDKDRIRQRVIELLEEVELPSPEQQMDNYPHQLSGGMAQRAMIAMALACHPELLIADEPTTALDVTVQAQILNLFSKLKDKEGISILLITHDLAVVSEIADTVTVMYAGLTMESSGKDELFKHPLHPYTQALLRSVPLLEPGSGKKRLEVIAGNVQDTASRLLGCPFYERCDQADNKCRIELPALVDVGSEHWVRCWRVK